MTQSFLEQVSREANQKNRRLYIVASIVFTVLMTFIIFAMKDELIDVTDYKTKKVIVCFGALIGWMLFMVIFGLIKASRVAVNGKNLMLPFKENTKEMVGKIIDREMLEGKALVDEYIYDFSDGKKPYGLRVILLPSYLLFFNGRSPVTAIPRDKIYWVCAQVGRKGSSSYVVRLMIFTEKKTFYLDGVEVEHVEKIAEKIYEYIPNVFCDYDPFILSYQLDALFDKDKEAFFTFYEEEKQKKLWSETNK